MPRQQHRSDVEVQAGTANERACLCGIANDDAVPIAVGVLLNQDGVGAGRHGRSGEDANRLPGADRPAIASSRNRLANDCQFGACLFDITGADCISVHRGSREGGLLTHCREIPCKHAAARLRQSDALRPKRFGPGKDATKRFVNRNEAHRPAVSSTDQSPDLPPDFFRSRMAEISIPRSTAFAMS